MLMITKLRNIDPKTIIDITVKEYADVYSVPLGGAYETLRAAQSRLWDRSFKIDGLKRRWIITCDYVDQQGHIKVQAHDHLVEHISGLIEYYTQYYLRRAGNFRSGYSWRLFELLMQFRTTGILKIALSEFKEILEIPKSYDKDFQIIRIKVINPALKEIKAAGLPVKLKTEKKGRSIHMLIFTFPLEQQSDWVANAAQQTSGANSKQRITKKQIEKHAKPGESYSEAQERLQRELDSQQDAANGQ